MSFDELLDRLWLYDYEVFAHDNLMVAISYRTGEEYDFHNASSDDYQNFFDTYNPIMMGYNNKSYDQYILKACCLGYSLEEVKTINDFIIDGHNGWEYPFAGYYKVPPQWDLIQCIKTFKSLKELEGNLRLNIVECEIPFDLPTKLTNEQYEQVLKYCRADVKALKPLFDRLVGKYKSKFVICKFGNIESKYGLGMTDASLTADLLGAERIEHDDPFLYEYPDKIQKEKIPKEALEYFDDLILHNDLNYKREAPCLDLGTIDFQLGVGGCHGYIKQGSFFYDRGDDLRCN